MRDRSRLFPNDRAKLNMSHLANIPYTACTQHRQTRSADFFQTAIPCRQQQRKSIGMGAGDWVKQFGRTDQPRPLVDRADSPCEQLLSRCSCSAFSGGYSLAEPQPLLVDFGTCRAKYACTTAVSMHISKRKQRRAARRPRALPNP